MINGTLILNIRHPGFDLILSPSFTFSLQHFILQKLFLKNEFFGNEDRDKEIGAEGVEN